MKHTLSPEFISKTSRLLQSELGAWRDCQFDRCIRTQSCNGGPRGTCLKTGGWPLCTVEGRERNRIAGRRKKWPGEIVQQDETISERAMRRLNDMLTRMTLTAKLENGARKLKSSDQIPAATPPWK